LEDTVSIFRNLEKEEREREEEEILCKRVMICSRKRIRRVFSTLLRPIKRKRGQDPFERPPSANTFSRFERKDFFDFEVLYESKISNARVGIMRTPHGIVDTPGFVPVATNGTLKAVSHRQSDRSGTQLMFCNTYHLLLRPGVDVIDLAGGLHQWMNRIDRPIITDSGGFQIFSLAHGSVTDEVKAGGSLKANRRHSKYQREEEEGSRTSNKNINDTVLRISEEGVLFKSYLDGQRIELTPEISVRAQKSLGADLIVPLDELPPYHVSKDRLRESVFMTHRWEARSLREHLRNPQKQAMMGIIHGGVDRELREISAEYITSLPFDTLGIGGSIGGSREEMLDLLKFLMPLLNCNNKIHRRPVHLLGIADEESIRSCVPLGLDTFDSCYPTRAARHGLVFTRKGKIKIKRRVFESDLSSLDEECRCETCQNHSKAYLNHLYRAREPSAAMYLTIHNIQYMNDMMKSIRQNILDGAL
jgi:queuine tRNA-ribosyltransferase